MTRSWGGSTAPATKVGREKEAFLHDLDRRKDSCKCDGNRTPAEVRKIEQVDHLNRSLGGSFGPIHESGGKKAR